MSETVKHPIFARVYHWMSAKAEEAGEVEHRRELLAGLHGRVLELGASNGLNFEHYPESVGEVVAVEPEAYLCEGALEGARKAKVRVDVVDGLAGRLAFKHQGFDAAVVSSVLCTVPDVDAALSDLRRVIRPGGELRFYEHVLARQPRLAALQRALTRSGIWPLIGVAVTPTATPPPRSSAPALKSRTVAALTFARRCSSRQPRRASSGPHDGPQEEPGAAVGAVPVDHALRLRGSSCVRGSCRGDAAAAAGRDAVGLPPKHRAQSCRAGAVGSC